MNFGISDNSCMFVTIQDQESILTNEGSAFFMLLSDVPYLKNKLLKSLWIAVLRCMQLILGRIREASSFLYFINFKFHTQMTKNRENLNKGANVASLSSTQPSEKGKSQLQKLLQSALKKADEKEAENKRLKNELYRLKAFIERYSSSLFPYFDKDNPVESQNWEKVYRNMIKVKSYIK